MILAAIDAGSNSVKLLIAACRRGHVRGVETRSAMTRLSEGLDRTGIIARAAQDRTIEVLRRFRNAAEKAGADRIVAVATEAVRVARNGRAFAARCRKETGLPLRILAGREEARLSFLGATSGRRERRLAAIDIGGGSTEIMVGSPGLLREAASLPLGAVRITERHLATDPPSLSERLAMLQAVTGGLDRLPGAVRRAATRASAFIGIGGTCVNVARMIRPSASPENRRVSLRHLESLLNRLAELPLARRKRVPGIDRDRADIILAGARILVETMRRLEIPAFIATVHGLRRGLILEGCRGSAARL